MDHPLNIGLVGLDGYAAVAANHLATFGAHTQPGVRLAAVLPPPSQRTDPRLETFRGNHIAVAESLADLVARPDIEALWLPVPIHLHRPFTETALAAGKAVLCEKPITGSLQDVDAMIHARDQAGLPVAVAYQHTYDPLVMKVKRDLLAGALGRIEHATLIGCWPRSTRYYRRSDWPGKIQVGDTWVLDSPAHNALSHFLNLGLLLLGDSLHTSALPNHVAAELYRVNDIQNYDTVTLRAQLRTGADFIVAMTHACRESVGPILEIHGTRGKMVWSYNSVQLSSTALTPASDLPRHMLERFGRLARGIPDETRFYATLEMARAPVFLINAVSEAAAIAPVPARFIVHQQVNDEEFNAIPGIEDALRRCVAERKLLHETGALPFTAAAGELDTRNYRVFRGPR